MIIDEVDYDTPLPGAPIFMHEIKYDHDELTSAQIEKTTPANTTPKFELQQSNMKVNNGSSFPRTKTNHDPTWRKGAHAKDTISLLVGRDIG